MVEALELVEEGPYEAIDLHLEKYSAFHGASRQPFQLDMPGETDYGKIGQFHRFF